VFQPFFISSLFLKNFELLLSDGKNLFFGHGAAATGKGAVSTVISTGCAAFRFPCVAAFRNHFKLQTA
jgi:hypothetical protein